MFRGTDCHVGNLVTGNLGAGRKHLWGQQSEIQAAVLYRGAGSAGGSWRLGQSPRAAGGGCQEPGVISKAYADMLSISRDQPEILLKE